MPLLVHTMWNGVVVVLAENGRKIWDEPDSILGPILYILHANNLNLI